MEFLLSRVMSLRFHGGGGGGEGGKKELSLFCNLKRLLDKRGLRRCYRKRDNFSLPMHLGVMIAQDVNVLARPN